MKLNFVIYSQMQFCAVFELHSVFLGLLVTEACFLVGKKKDGGSHLEPFWE